MSSLHLGERPDFLQFIRFSFLVSALAAAHSVARFAAKNQTNF